MSAPVATAGGSGSRRIVLAVALMAIGINLRPVFSSLSAVLPEVVRDTGATPFVAGLLTTVPVVCLGLFSPLAPGLAGRIGAERAVLLAILVLAAGTALRASATIPALLTGAAVAAASIAVGNVLLPSLVKRDFPDRSALMTGCYSMALCSGGALGAGFTVPLLRATGSWSEALGLWAVPALAAGLLWLPFGLGRRVTRGAAPGRPAGLWRDPLAWRVTLFMGLQSALAYCVFGWMAPILRFRGFEAAEAGLWTSLSILTQVAASLVTPWLATRTRDQRPACYGLVLAAVAGLLGTVYAPDGLVPVSVLVQGFGQGGLFAVATLIIILRSPTPHVAAHLSGMAQGVGYVVAAFGPLLLGLLRDPSGSFARTGWLFAAIGLGAAWAASGAGRARLLPTRPAPVPAPVTPAAAPSP